MPRRRSTADWQQLFAEFDAGQQTVLEFCAERGLSAAYFAKRRAQLRQRGSAFAVGQVSSGSTGAVTIQLEDMRVRCDSSVPASWLAELIAALRA